MDQDIGGRLKLVRGSTPLPEFAARFRVSKSTLVRYEKGETLPDAGFLLQLCDELGLSPGWVLAGEGPMRREDVENCEKALVSTAGLDQDEYDLVPRYAVEVSAGHGIWPDQEQVVEKLAFKRSWLRNLGLQLRNLVLVTARGDSMEPTFYDGDLLLVDLSQTNIVDGGISVIRTDGLLLAKRLQAGFGDQVTVISDNPRYDRLTTTKDQLNIVGRVVWRGGKV